MPHSIMDPESDGTIAESAVKDLQAVLFPISPRKSSSDSYLSNWFLKSTIANPQLADGEDLSGQILKAKDSKELFAREVNCTCQPPRWPTECQVLEERVNHIAHTPSAPEPYYVQTGKEVQPKPIGEECGIVIYQYYPISAVNYFSRSSVGGSKYLLPTCPTPEDESLRFESRFESGNLAKAIKITSVYYELYLRTDLYTNRHMQWFYFRVTNMRKFNTYRFSIVNLMKDDSLFNDGMRPLMYSVKDAQLHSVGWRRCGDNITYFCNENINIDDPDQQSFNTLTFTIEFPHEEDTVYFAHSYPYTYSDLQEYLTDLSSHPTKAAYTNLRLLCKTLAGNNVYYITVTSPTPQTEIKKKKAIVITARVHPGETPASWMMKGVLDFITGDSGPARELRERFIFKIIPMLNPDGVIVGNNRCSLTGRDLNRQYRTVIRESYPSIWYTKLMIRRLLEDCGVAMYCDLHAHSRKHNIFIYGCENRRSVDKRLHEQVFPLMLHKNAADKFSFENCIFRIQRNKEGTGRIVMWMMGIANSYTMEASFGGSSLAGRAETHFTTLDYETMGKSFCQTLLDFYDEDPRKEKLRSKIVLRLVKEGSNADEPTNIKLSDYSSDNGDTSSSSSENECGGRDLDVLLVAPPPSPEIFSKTRLAKIQQIQQQQQQQHKKSKSRSPNATRKTLQICKTTLGLSFNRRNCNDFYETTSTDSESEVEKPKYTRAKKKKTKKKLVKKKSCKDHSDQEYTHFNRKSEEMNLSVLDLMPEGKFGKAQSWQKSLMHNTRMAYDSKRNISQQLTEVQTKLVSLKNKLWFGVGDADVNASLSWGPSNFCLPHSAPQMAKEKSKMKSRKSKSDKTEKKFFSKKSKCAVAATAGDTKDKAGNTKSKNGVKRQVTVDLSPVAPLRVRLKRSKSLTDSSTTQKPGRTCKEKTAMVSDTVDRKKLNSEATVVAQCETGGTNKKKKKKHKKRNRK